MVASKFGGIVAAILNLSLGGMLVYLFGIFLIFGDFPTGYNLPLWTLILSIIITGYLYFYFPKTKLWKNRGRAKKPVQKGFENLLKLTGSGIMLIGGAHIVYAIYLWLRTGQWKTISLGDWGITIFKVNEYGRFDTGWWAINKTLDYIILDTSAALPLIIIGYIIYTNAEAD